MGALLARSQHNAPILYIGVQRVARADIKAAAKRSRKNHLSLRGNLGLHGKTILPPFGLLGNHNFDPGPFSLLGDYYSHSNSVADWGFWHDGPQPTLGETNMGSSSVEDLDLRVGE